MIITVNPQKATARESKMLRSTKESDTKKREDTMI